MFPPVVDGGCSRKTMVSESSPVDLVVVALSSNHWQSLPVSSSHRSIDNKIVPTHYHPSLSHASVIHLLHSKLI